MGLVATRSRGHWVTCHPWVTWPLGRVVTGSRGHWVTCHPLVTWPLGHARWSRVMHARAQVHRRSLALSRTLSAHTLPMPCPVLTYA
eukprot:3100350-Rhodomonas_salina.1